MADEGLPRQGQGFLGLLRAAGSGAVGGQAAEDVEQPAHDHQEHEDQQGGAALAGQGGPPSPSCRD